MLVSKTINRNSMIEYIQAVLVGGISKKKAYLEFIDPNSKDAAAAVNRMEKRPDFIKLHASIKADDALQMEKSVSRVKLKYVKLIEKNMDTMSDVLDNAEDMKEKAIAVRLANETITAMGIIDRPTESTSGQPALNRGGVIIS